MKNSKTIPIVGIVLGALLGAYALYSGTRIQQGVFADTGANGAQLGGTAVGSLVTMAGSAFMLWRQGKLSGGQMAESGLLTGLLGICLARGDTAGIAKITDLASHFASQPRGPVTTLPTNPNDVLGWVKSHGGDIVRDLLQKEMAKITAATPPT